MAATHSHDVSEDVETDDVPAQQIVLVDSVTKASNYAIISEAEINEEMSRIVQEVHEVLGKIYASSILNTALMFYKWDKDFFTEKFFEGGDPAGFFLALQLPATGLSCKSVKEGVNECGICSEDKSLTGFQCGHFFCVSVESCLGWQCLDPVPRIQMQVSVRQRFRVFACRELRSVSQVQEAFGKIFCSAQEASSCMPADGCNRFSKLSSEQWTAISCACGLKYCFQCQQPWHYPLDCTRIRQWLKKCSDDSETANYIMANTKECPKCKGITEKNGGCNHMTSRTSQEQSRAELARYLHYYNRFANHRLSLSLENKLVAEVNLKIVHMQSEGVTWTDAQYLLKAVDVLRECRMIMMYSYAFAYYLQKNNSSEIFEANQNNLEMATEKLSHLLENKLDNVDLTKLKQEIQDCYRYVDSRKISMLGHCKEGYQKNEWLSLRMCQPTVTPKNPHKHEVNEPLSFSGSIAQAIVESAHPYKSGQINSQKVTFEKTVEFLYIRFHDECQTLQTDDCLRVFVAASTDEDSQGSTFYPLGKYSGSKDWPETMLLVPGNCLWFILETSPSQEECSDPSKMYGFRCTIDGISSSSSPKDFNTVLGQEFTWLCANACRLLVQLPSSNTQIKQLCVKEQYTREFLRKHGSLLKKGLNIPMPVLKQVLASQLPKTRESQELKFLKEFIDGDLQTSAGALARMVVSQPFVDLKNSTLEMEHEKEPFCAGTLIKLTFVPRDQYNEIVEAVEYRRRRAGIIYQKALKTLQLAEPYRSVYVNKARYLSITMMPAFSNYSFEELRLSFQHTAATKVNIKFEKVEHSDSPGSLYCAQWKPSKAGHFQLQCLPFANSLLFQFPSEKTAQNQQVNGYYYYQTPSPVTPLPNNPKPHHRAVCPVTSTFKAIRIRSHPTLSAHQIGVLPRGIAFNYTEMVKNGDGVWLKLANEAKAHYTDHHHHHRSQNGGQAWCLQYNQHLQVEYLQVGTLKKG
uniref:RING-type domain-containing protein n=1 Tax=Ditylenchus dipsaci TaxID=166011 RepID=A0A915DCC7_9BILA